MTQTEKMTSFDRYDKLNVPQTFLEGGPPPLAEADTEYTPGAATFQNSPCTIGQLKSCAKYIIGKFYNGSLPKFRRTRMT